MTSICIHVSNGVFVSILVRINRRTGAMQTTVKIMKNTIKELDANNNRCSSPDGIKSSEKNCEYFPKSDHIFLDNLFLRREKSVLLSSIGQAIMQQVRPKTFIVSLRPKTFIVSLIQRHQHFGFRFSIDLLNKRGFCVPYSNFSSTNVVQVCTRELKFLVFLNLVQLNQFIPCTMQLIIPATIPGLWIVVTHSMGLYALLNVLFARPSPCHVWKMCQQKI